MPRATKEQSEITGRRILATASELFATRGFAAVGLEEVAAGAGVTRGAVYHHYAGKKGLFEAVAAAAQQRVAADVATAADDWDGFLAGCRMFLTAALADENRQILLVDAPAVLGWSTWRAQDVSARHLAEALTDLAAAGEIAVQSPGATTALLSGAMNEAALTIAFSADRDAALALFWPDLERLLMSLRA